MSHYGKRSHYSNQTVSTGEPAVTKYVPTVELQRTVFNQSVSLYLEQATWPTRQTQETDTWLSMAYIHATWTPLSCCKTTIVYGKYTWHCDIQC